MGDSFSSIFLYEDYYSYFKNNKKGSNKIWKKLQTQLQLIIPLIIERNGIILDAIVWNNTTGLIPSLGKTKNIIITIDRVIIIGMMTLALPFSFLDINKLNRK